MAISKDNKITSSDMNDVVDNVGMANVQYGFSVESTVASTSVGSKVTGSHFQSLVSSLNNCINLSMNRRYYYYTGSTVSSTLVNPISASQVNSLFDTAKKVYNDYCDCDSDCCDSDCCDSDCTCDGNCDCDSDCTSNYDCNCGWDCCDADCSCDSVCPINQDIRLMCDCNSDIGECANRTGACNGHSSNCINYSYCEADRTCSNECSCDFDCNCDADNCCEWDCYCDYDCCDNDCCDGYTDYKGDCNCYYDCCDADCSCDGDCNCNGNCCDSDCSAVTDCCDCDCCDSDCTAA